MPAVPTVKSGNTAIPAIGFGTWPLTGEDCTRAVATAIKAGYRHIDTAARYENEQAVGDGIRAGGVAREQLWVTTKVWWDRIGDGELQRSAEASLKALGLAHVDLLLIHWPNKDIPLAQSLRALADAKRRGLARHVGVSNFTVKLLDEAVAISPEPIINNQCEHHPHLDSTKILAACRKHGISLTAYCPIGRGANGPVLAEPVIQAIAARVQRTPAQVVLRWHMQQPGVIAVPKSSNPQRIDQNLAVFDFELTADDMQRISGLARKDGRVVKNPNAPEWD